MATPKVKKAIPKSFKAGIWWCPRCGNKVEIFVKMTMPPACHNHIGGAFAIMELQKKERVAK